MFLHIGEGKIVNKKNIIGIFDLETASVSKKTQDFFKKSEKKGIVKTVCEEIPKTFVVCENKKQEDLYITQLSSQTLLKRAERNEEFGTEN